MKQKCNNSNAWNYQWYGALGVKVCEAWLKFENFLKDMGTRPVGMTLDRIDPAKNYEPINCRWASASIQGRNKRKPF